MSLDQRSLDKLQGVRPELASVIKAASELTKFRITEGLRSLERQKLLVSQRKSKTMNSRHITGHAIDFIAIGEDGIATYDMDDMQRVADVISEVAKEHGVKIERGIDWGWDAPHIELDRKAYPANAVGITTRAVEVASKAKVAAPAAAASTAAIVEAAPSLPPPPDLTALSQYKAFGEQVSSLGAWAFDNWWISAGLAVWLAGAWALKFWRPQ